MFRRLLLVAPLFVLAMAPPAWGGGAHQEETDGCDHGATSKPCRPDPSENGKDCDAHGNHGGVNEDHCLTTITTISPAPTTTTIVTPNTTPTTLPTVSPTSTTTQNVVSTPETGSTTPYLGCMTPDGFPYLTNIQQGGCSSPQTDTPKTISVGSELPRTGWDAGLLFVIGTALILSGLSCWFCGKAID